MLNNMKFIKVLVLLLIIYSAGITVVHVTGGNSANSEEQITFLNNQVIQLNAQISGLQKDNDDLKTIREIMEKEQEERDAAQKRHEKSLSNLQNPITRTEGIDDLLQSDIKWK